MAIGTRIGPDGRPIDEGFFGLGNALASLPGTPVLPGATTPPPATGGYEQPGAQGPLAGGSTPPSTPQTNPGLPPPPSTAGTGGFFGGANPFQTGVTGTQNNQTVPFASERYVTPEAAQRLGSLLGANVVEQNTQGMASPGSGAPSQPMLGLDFQGQGDVQDASMGAFQLARGDRPEDVAARYKAGLTTKAWAGDQPVPQLAEAWDAPYWNRSTPVSTNTPNAEQAGFFGPQSGQGDQTAFFNWLKGQLGQG
jgi:hypothetical protein